MAESQSTAGLVYASALTADAFARSLLQAHGVPAEDAAIIAGCLVSADLRGVDEVGDHANGHPIAVGVERDRMAQRHVRESHQHPAVAILHAVRVRLGDEESALVRLVRIDALVERTDLAAKTLEPVHPHVAVGNFWRKFFEEVVGHVVSYSGSGTSASLNAAF